MTSSELPGAEKSRLILLVNLLVGVGIGDSCIEATGRASERYAPALNCR
jgi:hypothetical protein